MTLGLLKELSEKSKQKTFFLTHESFKELFEVIELKNIEYIFTQKTLNSALSLKDQIISFFLIMKLLAFRTFDSVFICYQDSRYKLLVLFSLYKKIFSLEKNKQEYFGDTLLKWVENKEFEFPNCSLPGIKKTNKKVVLYPGGNPFVEVGKALRMWPIEYFVQLASMLISKGFEVVILGSDEDQQYQKFFHHLPVIYSFSSSLKISMNIIFSADWVVSPDSGPMHLALLCKSKLIALFGATNYQTRIPKRALQLNQAKILSNGKLLSCSPCYDGKKYADCKNAMCMKMITPEHVLREIFNYENSAGS